MRAHLVQLSIAWHDKAANHERVAALLDMADVSPGDFVLLPEMFDTGFSFDVEATNDKNGRTLEFLLELAEDMGVVVQGGRTVAACHSEQCAARNIMTAVGPGGERGVGRVLCEYTKIHPFSLGGEQTRFPGGSEVMVYAHAYADGAFTIQPAICYDLRFPELFRAGLAKGADVIAIGACWPSARAAHWRALLVARAIENQAYVLGVNRVGSDPDSAEKPGLKYAGGTIAVSPRGEVLGELGSAEGVLSVVVDPKEIRRWREVFPAWKDRRM